MSSLRNRLIQIDQQIGDHRPGGVFGRVEIGVAWGVSVGKQLFRRGLVGLEDGELLLQGALEDFEFLGRWRASRCPAEAEGETRLGGRAPFGQHPFRQTAGGFDILLVVHQGQRLERRVGARPSDRAVLSRWGVKCGH